MEYAKELRKNLSSLNIFLFYVLNARNVRKYLSTSFVYFFLPSLIRL